MEKDIIIVNLMGGPCCGKSTIASGVFYELKRLGINCELVTEFAKDKVWEEAFKSMDDQIYIFAKQFHKLWRLRDKVDVIITDSPLLLSIFYMKEQSDFFIPLVLEQYNRFNNMLYFIERGETYQISGRMQTLDENKRIDESLLKIINDNKIEHCVVRQSTAVGMIVAQVIDTVEKKREETIKEIIDLQFT